MRILALDHDRAAAGIYSRRTVRPVSGPVEKTLVEKEIDLILIGQPRNMDGSYGPAAQKVEAFVAVLKTAITVPIKMWDERLMATMANKVLIQGGVRRDKRKEKVDKMAAAIFLQIYLDMRM